MRKSSLNIIVLFCIFLFGCKEKTDIEFAKEFFENLADGKASVMDDIDWENFSGTGFNIGGKLRSINDKKEKENIKKNFISSFSESFNKTSITKEKFTNWKIEDDNMLSTVVSAVFEEDCYLYIVILKKNKVKKISSLMLSSPDLKLSKLFCSTNYFNTFDIEANITTELPQSLLDKHSENKNRKDAELIKKSGYRKRIGIEYKRDIFTEEDIEIGKSSEDYFDSNGYNIKTIHYDESEKPPLPPTLKLKKENENNLLDGPEKRIIEETKKPVKKDYTIKLIDEKTGLYEEKSNSSTFYYSLADSGNYKFYKINSEYSTQIFKYNSKGYLINIISISIIDSGYKSMSAIYYDSLKNIIRISEYLYNGLIADSSYTIKYDTYGKVLENVGYYAPGTFYGFFNIILKCHIEYDNKDNIIERQFVRTNRNDQSLIYLYNINGKIYEINYMNFYPFSTDWTFGNVTLKYNSKELLIEKIEHNTPDVFVWVTKYTYYK